MVRITKIFSKILVKSHELADAEGREQKRNGEASGVDGEEKDAAADGVAGGGESKHGGEDGADAGRPAEGEREAEKEAAPDAGLRGFAVKVNVAIEPTGHGRAEKADEREREEMSSAESGEKRGVSKKRGDSEGDQEHAEDDAGAKIELDERADEVKAEEKN